ncbi:MAG: sigma-54-dependent Fis family transcriptional regulator [Acidobacteria bacterium]|nr:MAG: sigma-54-dependent Fis family transcriptional regulator [Acidobacteriota bacterium]
MTDMTGRILIVDDDSSLVDSLTGLLEHAGYAVRATDTGAGALSAVGSAPTDLVLLDLRLGSESGLELLPRLKALRPEMSVIVVTALGTIENAVEAMRLGADDFIVKPVEPKRLLAVLAKGLEARELRRRSEGLERLATGSLEEVHGQSPAMLEALRLADTVAPRETTVLLVGETGTGKGLLARRIHAASKRAGRPFVELNCAGLQRELTETELFGHDKGAFTGATRRKLGLFEAADGGTLLLDEVGEMDAAVQAKLLHVLEQKRFRRVGGLTEIEVDVRVLAATHRDLEADVAAGRFREDLLYRLNVFTIVLPPLRERTEDILPLARLFLARYRGDGRAEISEAAARRLTAYDWPGNVRELRNVMERAAILAPPGTAIDVGHLPELAPHAQPCDSTTDAGDETLAGAERHALEQALRSTGGNILETARRLGIARGTLYRKIRKYGIPLGE